MGQMAVSITACIEERESLFRDPSVVHAVTDILAESAERHGCTVPVFCFMPDHLHLILQGETPCADTWAAITEFKQRSGFWLYTNKVGASWQKGYHDHVLRKDEDIVAHIRYILDNPCRRGIAHAWENYPFKGSIGHILEQVLSGLVPVSR